MRYENSLANDAVDKISCPVFTLEYHFSGE